MMLSFNGARQISGNNVNISIFIGRGGSPNRPLWPVNNQRQAIEVNRPYLFDNLQRGTLAVAGSGAVQQRTNCVNGLAVATDDAADVALAELDFENSRLTARDFREHHIVGKFDQLANDE